MSVGSWCDVSDKQPCHLEKGDQLCTIQYELFSITPCLVKLFMPCMIFFTLTQDYEYLFLTSYAFFPSFISIVHVVHMIKKIPSRLDQDSCHSTHKACVSAQSLSLCCSSAEPHLTSSASLYPSSTHTHSVWFKPLEQTAS